MRVIVTAFAPTRLLAETETKALTILKRFDIRELPNVARTSTRPDHAGGIVHHSTLEACAGTVRIAALASDDWPLVVASDARG